MYFFCKQKTAYELRISDWSSDVCSSDLVVDDGRQGVTTAVEPGRAEHPHDLRDLHRRQLGTVGADAQPPTRAGALEGGDELVVARSQLDRSVDRSEERRVGTAWVRTGRSRLSRYLYKKNKTSTNQ